MQLYLVAENLSELFKACEPLDSPKKKINNSLRGRKGDRGGADGYLGRVTDGSGWQPFYT